MFVRFLHAAEIVESRHPHESTSIKASSDSHLSLIKNSYESLISDRNYHQYKEKWTVYKPTDRINLMEKLV